MNILIREASELKNVTIFLTPLPQDVLDFFEFGKNWKFGDPSPLRPNWEKFEIGKILNFGTPLKKRNISLKHLKWPKNRFINNLFFVQLRYLKSSFTIGHHLCMSIFLCVCVCECVHKNCAFPKIQNFPNFKFFPIRSEAGVIKFPISPKFKKVQNILGEGVVNKISDFFHNL